MQTAPDLLQGFIYVGRSKYDCNVCVIMIWVAKYADNIQLGAWTCLKSATISTRFLTVLIWKSEKQPYRPGHIDCIVLYIIINKKAKQEPKKAREDFITQIRIGWKVKTKHI